MTRSGTIRVGIGGWNYAPWRDTFYPADVTLKRQLEYASRQVSAIEVNGTFYRLQTPTVFGRWHDATPEHFMFALKAPRFITHRRELATAGESVQRFLDSGITQLRHKLGPILWQLPPGKTFDARDIEAFLSLLPQQAGGLQLRHALEVRHDSFVQRSFVKLARRHGTAIVMADSAKYPTITDVTADFIYLRLMNAIASQRTGYRQATLASWAARAQTWAAGTVPAHVAPLDAPAKSAARDVFMFAINGAKERAPAAAGYLLKCLQAAPARHARVKTSRPSTKSTAAKRQSTSDKTPRKRASRAARKVRRG